MLNLLNDNFDLMPIIRANLLNLKLTGLKNSERRSVYISGFYFSLIIALYYEEAGRPEIGAFLWDYLQSYHIPQPSSVELVAEVERLSFGTIRLETKFIPNPSFRYGVYGHLYVKGTRDGFDLCLKTVPELIRKKAVGDNRGLVLDWLNRQMLILNPLPDGVIMKFVND